MKEKLKRIALELSVFLISFTIGFIIVGSVEKIICGISVKKTKERVQFEVLSRALGMGPKFPWKVLDPVIMGKLFNTITVKCNIPIRTLSKPGGPWYYLGLPGNDSIFCLVYSKDKIGICWLDDSQIRFMLKKAIDITQEPEREYLRKALERQRTVDNEVFSRFFIFSLGTGSLIYYLSRKIIKIKTQKKVEEIPF